MASYIDPGAVPQPPFDPDDPTLQSYLDPGIVSPIAPTNNKIPGGGLASPAYEDPITGDFSNTETVGSTTLVPDTIVPPPPETVTGTDTGGGVTPPPPPYPQPLPEPPPREMLPPGAEDLPYKTVDTNPIPPEPPPLPPQGAEVPEPPPIDGFVPGSDQIFGGNEPRLVGASGSGTAPLSVSAPLGLSGARPAWATAFRGLQRSPFASFAGRSSPVFAPAAQFMGVDPLEEERRRQAEMLGLIPDPTGLA